MFLEELSSKGTPPGKDLVRSAELVWLLRGVELTEDWLGGEPDTLFVQEQARSAEDTEDSPARISHVSKL